MDREQVLAIIDTTYAARVRGDQEAVAAVWAEGARFEIAGERTLIEAFPGSGSDAAQPAVASLIQLVQMTSATRLDAVVEGLKAAVLWQATVSFAGRPPFETRLYDLIELNEDGKVVSLRQFADTAKIASEMAALGR